ncbi:MAG TPA: HAMP domain-containing sensor histidine kinase [Acidimicrobiia bacterium]|nr:HAMP domain-containing sensor histidine kinase [Acidimicrobiia bacterium]
MRAPAAGTPARRRLHLPRGLRFRVTAGFALGGLLLSAVVAILTYTFTEHYLVQQRERSLLRQAYVDARIFREDVRRDDDVNLALEGFERSVDSIVILSYQGEWLGTSVELGRDQLPSGLRGTVEAGEPARQRFDLGGEAWFAVGVPIAAIDARYYQAFRLEELQRTLGVLRTALLGAGAVATALIGLLGWWASGRLLRPVSEIASASERVTKGELRTRLEPQRDPDLDRLVTSFNGMVDALGQRIERDARFVSDVSHELRSPLTTLATAADLLHSRRHELPDRSRVALELLVGEVNRFRQMVEDLLELSRADSGVDELDLEAVRLGDLVQRTLGSHGGKPRVDVDPGAGQTPVLVDRRRLDRVLLNLVDNARSHGGGVIAITVRRRDGSVRLEVDDAGPGVAVTDRARIFERFARGGASGRRPAGSGSGLGLALVSEHVRLHGGRVWVQDVPGGDGARFVVEIPWRPA